MRFTRAAVLLAAGGFGLGGAPAAVAEGPAQASHATGTELPLKHFIDRVARAMDTRQDSVQSQARGLRDAALYLALQHDAVTARSTPIGPDTAQALVVRNRAARAIAWRSSSA